MINTLTTSLTPHTTPPRFGLYPLLWITQVNGSPVADLDSFVEAVRDIGDRASVSFRTVDLQGRQRMQVRGGGGGVSFVGWGGVQWVGCGDMGCSGWVGCSLVIPCSVMQSGDTNQCQP